MAVKFCTGGEREREKARTEEYIYEIKLAKKCNFGTMQEFLTQKLKSMVFEIFLSGGCRKQPKDVKDIYHSHTISIM